ncbi:MAG: type II toxin-antitoxin system PemK/MazF family toxin [Mycobacteriaceae bacterium]|nr:type II toxin-antitoxin system PemK/MazF family toxin [Mycobacteriaceae bacterium]
MLDRGGRIIEQLQDSRLVPRPVAAVLAAARPALPAVTIGQSVASAASATAERTRRVRYAPNISGPAQPGEVVWAWVVSPDDPGQGRDLPVLVIGRDGDTLPALLLSPEPPLGRGQDWVEVGPVAWDDSERAHWVRMDLVLDVPEASIRREAAVLDRSGYDRVAHRLCQVYGWG